MGYEVNGTLVDFYKGNHETYSRSNPSIFASQNNFAINECPVSEYTQEVKDSFAQYSDAAIVVIARSGGEGDDLSRQLDESEGGGTYLELTTQEKEMLEMVAGAGFGKIVVLINSCNAMELGFLDQAEYGIDDLHLDGRRRPERPERRGAAVQGRHQPLRPPGGHHAYDSLSSPAMQNFGGLEYTNGSELDNLSESYFGVMTQYTGKNYVVYQEGIYVGYRYYETRYEDAVMGTGNAGDYDYASTVQFPFGYGMSYTTFEHSNFTFTPNGDTFTVTVDVTNTGSVAGKDVVQIYFQSPTPTTTRPTALRRPPWSCAALPRTGELAPGETETVTVEVNKEELRTYDADGAKTYILDTGDYYCRRGRQRPRGPETTSWPPRATTPPTA